MKLGFTGTQHGMTTYQKWNLMKFMIAHQLAISESHHGCCIGSDHEFHLLCVWLELRIILHPPVNTSKSMIAIERLDVYPEDIRHPLPFLKRNHATINDTDWLVATPKTRKEVIRSGTWATIRYARKVERETTILRPTP